MKFILRATRAIVAVVVSLHVATLRGHANLSLRKLNKAVSATDSAKAGLRFAQDAVSFARVNVREMKNAEAQRRAEHSSIAMAADAEAKYWGRSL